MDAPDFFPRTDFSAVGCLYQHDAGHFTYFGWDDVAEVGLNAPTEDFKGCVTVLTRSGHNIDLRAGDGNLTTIYCSILLRVGEHRGVFPAPKPDPKESGQVMLHGRRDFLKRGLAEIRSQAGALEAYGLRIDGIWYDYAQAGAMLDFLNRVLDA